MELKYRLIPEGDWCGIYVPISVALVDYEDVQKLGISTYEACQAIAKTIDGPAAINIWDLKTAVTTTSDGVMIDGSIVAMASSDRGKINKEFGYAEMLEIPWGSETCKTLLETEPHQLQWKENYPGRRMLTHPKNLKIPVHQATITGRAGNNNSATEMMHYINMEELLMPLIGQLELLRDGDVEVGKTGNVISVGIGMVTAEEYGRIVPHGQFPTGNSAHSSGKYAQTLKSHIPVIAADKSVLAKYIIDALKLGLQPGRDFGASPAVVSVARHMKDAVVAGECIGKEAYEEMETVGFTKEWMLGKGEIMSEEEIIKNAHEIIPGIENPVRHKATEVAKLCYAPIEK